MCIRQRERIAQQGARVHPINLVVVHNRYAHTFRSPRKVPFPPGSKGMNARAGSPPQIDFGGPAGCQQHRPLDHRAERLAAPPETDDPRLDLRHPRRADQGPRRQPRRAALSRAIRPASRRTSVDRAGSVNKDLSGFKAKGRCGHNSCITMFLPLPSRREHPSLFIIG